MMQRREFIAATVATAAMGLPRRIWGQTSGLSRVTKRIAIFHPTEPPAGLTITGRRAYKTYFEELNRLGYVEGQNLVVERYSALGQSDRYGDLARDIVASHPDLIVSVSGVLARLLKSLTATIPILATTADPIAAGLVTNLANPERNITGVSADAGLEVNGKRLQFLGETARRLSNVRFLSPASGSRMSEATVAVLREAAGRTAITIAPAILEGKVDREAFERAFDAMEKDRVDGLIVSDSPEHVTNRQLIVDLAARHRLPAVYPFREFAEVGGLMSYGVDTADLMHRLAEMTGQVLGGAKPREIPFQQQTRFELVLNRTAAASLGLEFPATMLATADDVFG